MAEAPPPASTPPAGVAPGAPAPTQGPSALIPPTPPIPPVDPDAMARALARELYAFLTQGGAEVVRLDEFQPAQPGGLGINLPALGTIQVPPTFGGTSVYTTILAVLPTGGGTLTLGGRIIALPAGVNVLFGLAVELSPTAERILTCTNGGLCWFELFGHGLTGTGAGVVRTAR